MHISLATEVFSLRQACEVVGITQSKARHWDVKGVVKPSVRPAAGRGSHRLYSYVDLLALKTVQRLREQGISLQKVRRCVQYLRKNMPDVSQPLSFCTLMTDGIAVFLVEDEQTLMDTTKRQGQRALLQLSIAAIDRDLRERVLKLTTKRVESVEVGDRVYQVEVQGDVGGGYVAEVAGLPGCVTQGETIAEVREMAADAIMTYLEAADELARRGIKTTMHRQRKRRSRTA